ncbi:uncharacterized protein I206_104921 [Kwoniella pini CBS 10737]|uniref:DUF7923 domain-containing protein n=1 Tax=Kwoniella pini CBS 10737 TaxID=1296096 RepID=A0A1B9I8C2_9TREE|nr:uncharacterized protein I206_02462 [Kwoniella pini CBS 10737]OCF51746.1 hypothetical protein I206_02462 [Kwoniella pini CBS 10737]
MSSSNRNSQIFKLVDLDSPPPSPPTLQRVKSISLLPKFAFDQVSLIPEASTPRSKSASRATAFPQETIREVDTPEHESQEILANPSAEKASRSPMTTKRDRTTSSSTNSSGTSKTSLSATATPFKLVKNPRQSSIVRNCPPLSFNFGRQQADTFTSSAIPHSSQVPPSDALNSATTLPIYPYDSSRYPQVHPYDSTTPTQVQPPVASPRASKAIRIISPLESMNKKANIVSQEEASGQHDSQEQAAVPAKPPSTVPKLSQAVPTLKLRRGKAEILSLYPVTDEGAAKRHNGNKDSSISTNFDHFLFSFSFPSQHLDVLKLAAETPLPRTPATASTLEEEKSPLTSDVNEQRTVLPENVPLPLTPRTPVQMSSEHGQAVYLNNNHLAAINCLISTLAEDFKQFHLDEQKVVRTFDDKLIEALEQIQDMVNSGSGFNPVTHNETQPVASTYGSRTRSLQVQVDTLTETVRQLNHAREAAIERGEANDSALETKREELTEAFTQFGHYKAEADLLRSKLQDTITEYRQVEIEKLHITHKCYKLAKALKRSHADLEESRQVARTISRPAQNETPFVAILLEGHARMFSHDLVKAGASGGKVLAARLIEAARAICKENIPDTPIERFTIELFLDVHRITTQLKVVNVVKNIGHMHSFLDGFINDYSSYYCDTEDPAGPAGRVKERINLYSSLDACKMILIGTSQARNCVRYLTKLKESGTHDKFHTIQSTMNSQNDPLFQSGMERNHKIDGFFTIDPDDWQLRYDRAKSTTDVTNPPSLASRTPSILSRPSSRASVSTLRPLSPHTEDNQSVRGPSLPPRRSFSSNFDPSEAPPWKHIGAHRESETVQDDASIVERKYNPSPVSTHQPTSVRHSSVTTGRSSKKQGKIVIPINPDSETEIGLSPPESDEDEPSVHLPHSAVKRIQRPTIMRGSGSEDADDIDSGLPPGFRARRPAVGRSDRSAISVTEYQSHTSPPWHQTQPKAPSTTYTSWKDIIGKQMDSNRRSSSISSFSEANTIPVSGRRSSVSTQPEEMVRSYQSCAGWRYLADLIMSLSTLPFDAVASEVTSGKAMSPSLFRRSLS